MPLFWHQFRVSSLQPRAGSSVVSDVSDTHEETGRGQRCSQLSAVSTDCTLLWGIRNEKFHHRSNLLYSRTSLIPTESRTPWGQQSRISSLSSLGQSPLRSRWLFISIRVQKIIGQVLISVWMSHPRLYHHYYFITSLDKDSHRNIGSRVSKCWQISTFKFCLTIITRLGDNRVKPWWWPEGL